MRIRNTGREMEDQPRLQMSSMIDIVFLLLVFFIMTFQITAAEGDIEIDTAQAGASSVEDDPPRETLFRVHIRADSAGNLGKIQFDGRELKTTTELESFVRDIVLLDDSSQHAVQLRSDAQLRYRYIMDTITAIRGNDPDHPQIRNIQFVDVR